MSCTVVGKVNKWTAEVERHLADVAQSDYLKRICVAVFCLAHVRLADMSMREHALIYWIAEGHRSLRFHNGDCFMKTPSGAFQQHKGVPPELAPGTPRTGQGLQEGIREVWNASDLSEDTFLERCLTASLDLEGETGARRRGGLGGDAVEDQPAGPWQIAAAKMIVAVKKQFAREMTEDKLLSFMAEWCDASKTPQASCCYEDCAVRYDSENLPAVQVPRAELEPCYLRIPHCIKGIVPAPVLERLQKFYSQTFWGNISVFKCGQAAQALAKRGLNVVRLFIGLSRGGVGQSLYSSHLNAMYGHNFAFFDPNVWFQEDEMRKQVEQLNDCCVLTGQETPAIARGLV